MMWQIYDENAKILVHITKIPKYQQRVNIKSQDTFTSMTIKDLMVTDIEKILCSAVCFVNEEIQYIADNGTVLTVTGVFGKIDVIDIKDINLWPSNY